MQNPILENARYELFLQGGIKTWQESGTSDHYYDYTDTHYQWRGSGVVRNKKTGISTQFNFSNEDSRHRAPPTELKHLLLQTTREIPDGRHDRRMALAPELVIPGQEEELTTIVCERILEELEKCQDPVKWICITPIPFELLVNKGFAPDYSGQFHIALR